MDFQHNILAYQGKANKGGRHGGSQKYFFKKTLCMGEWGVENMFQQTIAQM
jgi:hypothetical protein